MIAGIHPCPRCEGDDYAVTGMAKIDAIGRNGDIEVPLRCKNCGHEWSVTLSRASYADDEEQGGQDAKGSSSADPASYAADD